jgi:hypothetical protein
MNKTIYLRDDEAPIWERARELASDKLSPVIVAALKKFIAVKEAEVKGFERIEVSYNDADDHNIPKAKAFYGKWVYSPKKPVTLSDEEGEAFDHFAVAVTAKGAVVVYSWHAEREGNWAYRFNVYYSLENAAADERVNYAARKTIQELGVRVEELDI